jgi:hypothetical protein
MEALNWFSGCGLRRWMDSKRRKAGSSKYTKMPRKRNKDGSEGD